jgi:hypothetical protein
MYATLVAKPMDNWLVAAVVSVVALITPDEEAAVLLGTWH